MTVIDTSAIVDYLLDDGAAREVATLMESEGQLAAPELLIFEVLSALRRIALQGKVAHSRAGGAVEDLGDLPLELFPVLPLRRRAWELRRNLAAADAIFVALAEQLGEPLATKDAALARAAAKHYRLKVVELAR